MNILEFVEDLMEQGYSEETALRIWDLENDPDYDPFDYE